MYEYDNIIVVKKHYSVITSHATPYNYSVEYLMLEIVYMKLEYKEVTPSCQKLFQSEEVEMVQVGEQFQDSAYPVAYLHG